MTQFREDDDEMEDIENDPRIYKAERHSQEYITMESEDSDDEFRVALPKPGYFSGSCYVSDETDEDTKRQWQKVFEEEPANPGVIDEVFVVEEGDDDYDGGIGVARNDGPFTKEEMTSLNKKDFITLTNWTLKRSKYLIG